MTDSSSQSTGIARGPLTGVDRVRENIIAAGKAIWGNKTRSLLTSIGILIGVMNVVAMVGLISGVNESVMDVFRQLGTNTFIVMKMPAGNVDWEQYLEYSRRPDFTMADADAIHEICPAVLAVSPQSVVSQRIRYRNETTREIIIVGATPEQQYISDSAVGDGRFFAWPESERRRQVVVLGDAVRAHLFGSRDPIGENVLIGNRRFRVVGVMEPMGEMFGQSMDDYAMIPFETVRKLYGERLTTRLSIKATSGDEIEGAMAQVERVLRSRRGLKADEPNNFEIVTQGQLVEMYENLTRVTWIVMIGISAIALVVGGVGIMNIMLVSVTERTREIGIRKAVGARSRDILAQFLVESAVLSGLGGLFGFIAALALLQIVSRVTPIPASIEAWSVALAIGVSVAVGVFFGLFPASKAARLDPIVALRYE